MPLNVRLIALQQLVKASESAKQMHGGFTEPICAAWAEPS